MIRGEATAVIECTPDELLELVADPHRYRRADTKIARVLRVHRDGDAGRMWIIPRLRGLPGPPVRLDFRVVRGRRLEIHSAPRSLTALLAWFHGELVCEAHGERAVSVLHRESLGFRALLSSIAEPLLREWLARDVEAEVGRLKALIERR